MTTTPLRNIKYYTLHIMLQCYFNSMLWLSISLSGFHFLPILMIRWFHEKFELAVNTLIFCCIFTGIGFYWNINLLLLCVVVQCICEYIKDVKIIYILEGKKFSDLSDYDKWNIDKAFTPSKRQLVKEFKSTLKLFMVLQGMILQDNGEIVDWWQYVFCF